MNPRPFFKHNKSSDLTSEGQPSPYTWISFTNIYTHLSVVFISMKKCHICLTFAFFLSEKNYDISHKPIHCHIRQFPCHQWRVTFHIYILLHGKTCRFNGRSMFKVMFSGYALPFNSPIMVHHMLHFEPPMYVVVTSSSYGCIIITCSGIQSYLVPVNSLPTDTDNLMVPLH